MPVATACGQSSHGGGWEANKSHCTLHSALYLRCFAPRSPSTAQRVLPAAGLRASCGRRPPPELLLALPRAPDSVSTSSSFRRIILSSSNCTHWPSSWRTQDT